MKTEYKVLVQHDPALMETDIGRHLADGWEVSGNLTSTQYNLVQRMVRVTPVTFSERHPLIVVLMVFGTLIFALFGGSLYVVQRVALTEGTYSIINGCGMTKDEIKEIKVETEETINTCGGTVYKHRTSFDGTRSKIRWFN